MPKVLLLHTGGTLGMRIQEHTLAPGSYAAELLQKVPELKELTAVDSEIVCNLDSSDIGPTHWSDLAIHIANQRETYDGFVIIHGTDTMAYTASALAYALEGLDRPVILTGAQRPLAALRTDARRNLADAVELATCDIPEVGICFDGSLLRGCRATKNNSRAYAAFSSPGCQPLARLGVDIDIANHVRRPIVPFRCDARFDARVVVVYVTPGMHPRLIEQLLTASNDLKGIVLAAFGAGTLPTHTHPLAPVIKEIIDSGVDVLVVTQSSGRVNLGLYQNSQGLLEAGAIPGGEMLIEAAVTKLMHALAVYERRGDRRRYLEWNVAGER